MCARAGVLACSLLAVLLSVGCGQANVRKPQSPAEEFLAAVSGLCGKAFAGRWSPTNLPCDSHTELRVPFHVGEDRSRTWVLTLVGDRVRLKHDHRHKDGTEDAATMYGGDAFSKAVFTRENRAVSNTNVWAMEVHPGRMFAYELTRPGRKFRVEFDLTTRVPAPPAPWGQ